MKKLFIFLLATISTAAYSQTVYNGEGGFTGSPEILSAGNTVVNQQALDLTSPYVLTMGFSNSSVVSKIPAYTIEVHIDLGDNLVLDDGFRPGNASENLPGIFDWYVNNVNGRVVLVAKQKTSSTADIATLQSTLFRFEVKPKSLGASAVSGELRIVNSNSAEKLNDPMLVNNSTLATYTVTSTLPVTFSSLELQQHDCSISASWMVGAEQNVAAYEVEISTDGTQWQVVNTTAAAGLARYHASFTPEAAYQNAALLVRIKAKDADGRLTYSNTAKINSLCEAAQRFTLYPNPLTSGTQVTLQVSGQPLKGNYRIEVLDNQGKMVSQVNRQFNGVWKTAVDMPSTLPAGTYRIRCVDIATGKSTVLPLVRL